MGRFRGNLAAILAVIVLLLPGHLTEDVGKDSDCFKERKAASGMIGSFVKQCKEDGTFKTEQCWGSTGYCYCAHPLNGLIYDETALRSWEGQRNVDCNTYWMTQNERCSNEACRLARRGECQADTQKCGSCLEGYVEERGLCKDQGERNVLPDIDVITDKLLNEQQTTAGKYDEGNNHVEELRGEQTTTQREQQGSSPQAKPQKNTPPAATQYAHGINDILFLAIVVGCSVLGVIGLGIAGYCWWKLQQNVKMAADQDYPAYGVTGPGAKSQMTAGDKKLAQSAQMYHYQHQKQQMLAMEKNHGDMKRNDSDDETEEETEEGDYTVYECPGLAPTGEMEVKNPLFDHDSQPPPGSAK
ncbi:neural proliferation differentiation and control protein 1-like isoform X1 [Branchiostoma lanceolatum]|uniref:neural proliferation differentiation and control protein 1-like isoform X1 n=1 Tax=Branchiostoma lanceolatum TaxID=7740 RepID=UPI0034515851